MLNEKMPDRIVRYWFLLDAERGASVSICFFAILVRFAFGSYLAEPSMGTHST